jgi:hypothetical protein
MARREGFCALPVAVTFLVFQEGEAKDHVVHPNS